MWFVIKIDDKLPKNINMSVKILILILVVECCDVGVAAVVEKVCLGTSNGISTPDPTNKDLHYQILTDRYTNCTYVEGNLELTWIPDDVKYNLLFLQHIRQVSGYVLIHHVETKDVILPSLQIIVGKTLFDWNPSHRIPYALFIYDSTLSTLQLPSLRSILNGSVLGMMYGNVCFLDTIQWDEILRVGARQNLIYFNQIEGTCGGCDPTCEAGCWGRGPENCQKLFKCSKKCTTLGCFSRNDNDCCHPYCAGGCTGPTEQECLSCRNFNDSGVCRTSCPPEKFIFGGQCVNSCLEPYKNDSGTCVRTCPRNKISKDGECKVCGNGFCPKICIGHGTVNAQNIEKYSGCNIITGSVAISNETFDGYAKIHPDELHAFLDLQEVTDSLNIQGHHEQFTNLSFFKNLSVIGGSLYIEKSSLKSLELKSLKQLYGAVSIKGNDDLCYVGSLDWSKMQKTSNTASHVLMNRNPDDCKKDGFVCYDQCDESTGCMGGGADQCLECVNWTYEGTCVTDCSAIAETRMIFQNATSKTCGDCHVECLNSCSTSEADSCDACVNVKDEVSCVKFCPKTKYSANAICEPCHEVCDGCVGPEDTLSSDGCSSCGMAIKISTTEIKCLHITETCPDGFYPKITKNSTICHPCHQDCLKCTGPGLHEDECQVCAKLKSNDICVSSCTNDQYVNDDMQCLLCATECRRCHGPGTDNCIECENFVLPIENAGFNCIAECPEDYPFDVDTVCSKQPQYLVLIAVLAAIFLVMLVLILICCCRARKAHNEKVQMSLLAGFEDTVPLCETGASPNMRKIRIIKEAELRKGSVLGAGEFGQVLKGFWLPENENCKIPIAIKICKEMKDSKSSAEFMQEAQIMASLDHPNILKLLAICMTDDLMMITQLMPLGSLLNYVRTHKNKICSKVMLNWSAQIANGMAYLEQRRLVHRDLASRNVLVQSPTYVRITDFGMTKLLQHNKLSYQSTDGKAAVKWLAPECIAHKTFTSKSDVWAFGVTIWEVLTYGDVPYSKVKPRFVPALVAAGEKLPQPEICSLDLYAVLLLCWNLKPDLRPTFKDLATNFIGMAGDPGRYLMIVGDTLMRLPEFTDEDKQEMYEIEYADDTDSIPIVEAERYVDLRTVKPNLPTDADNYLLPNPPGELPEGPESAPRRSVTTLEIKVEEYLEPDPPSPSVSPGSEAQYSNIEDGPEKTKERLDVLGRFYINMIKNQTCELVSDSENRNSGVSNISLDPNEYLEPKLSS